MQVCILHSIFSTVGPYRLEFSVLFPSVYFYSNDSGWHTRPECEPEDTIRISSPLWVWPARRGLQSTSFLDYYVRHSLAECGSLLCPVFHLWDLGCGLVRFGLSVDNGSCHFGQCASGDGYQAVDMDGPPCDLGFNTCGLLMPTSDGYYFVCSGPSLESLVLLVNCSLFGVGGNWLVYACADLLTFVLDMSLRRILFR